MIELLLVEDDELFGLGLSMRLQREADMRVVATVSDGESALECLHSRAVDVVILDIGLPGLGGIPTCQQIKQDYPHLPVLILTSHSQPSLIQQLLQIQANGYCLKGIPGDSLILAIRSLMAGASWWDPVATTTLHTLCPRPASPPNPLTEREQEILKLIAQGYSNQAIAGSLYLSPGTVKAHVHAILQKLGVDHRAAAVSKAHDQGWWPMTVPVLPPI